MAVPQLKERDETSSRFEDNYLVRTLGRIATDAEIALTELVANAWDAGASLVDLTIPTARGQVLMVEDDGHGMSAEQFRDRWMRLGYDRVKHQSANVEFPAERGTWHRKAYGHNGVGRHGLLCFADRYTVSTWRDGRTADFDIGTRSEGMPFRIDEERAGAKEGHGTRLSVVVQRHVPDLRRLRAYVAARFLRDPQFIVRINGEAVDLTALVRPLRGSTLRKDGKALAQAQVVDAPRLGESCGARGIAFWVNGRLVGTPSWLVGEETVIDGRGRFASRYAVVIYLDGDWVTEVDQDWWRFKPSARVDALLESVRDYVRMVFAQISSALVDESSEEALVRNRDEFRELSPLGRAEIATFARDLMKTTPTVSQDVLSAAVLAAIKLEKSRGGAALLERLGTLEESDIEGLNRLLSQWTVRDALTVLDEIDHRMALIAAIEKLSADPATDELQTLHPLVTQARWLFGPEFDSTEYASNVSLRTATETIFRKRLSPDAFINHRKRPDLVLLSDATCSVVGAEGFDPGDEALVRHRHVLIVELKRGRHAVGREDVSQAYNYVQDFYCSGALDGPTLLTSFVVGHTVSGRAGSELVIMDMGLPRGKVQAVTYGQLTRSAHRRLLRLKERIPARYEDVTGADLSAKVMRGAPQACQAITEAVS